MTGLYKGENVLKRILERWSVVQIQLSLNMVKLWITCFTGYGISNPHMTLEYKLQLPMQNG